MSIKSLRRSLETAGKKTLVCENGDGSRLLLLPYGARVLGLYPPSSDDNFYWVNRDLDDPESARALFRGDGWHNTGGDRTWLTPELDIFFPDYPQAQQHWEPPQLDARVYSTRRTEGGVSMSRKMTLHFARPNRDIELELTKWVGPAQDPLRREAGKEKRRQTVEYAGYSQRTKLRLLGTSAKRPVPVGIWNLVQLPHGGQLLVPTYTRTLPRVLFGKIPSESLVCEDKCIRFNVNLAGEQKIAVRAAATTGRVGYLYRWGRKWSLVVRNFFVNPSGEYVDVPKDDPQDLGYSVNAVNVNSNLGDFCELEYHAPATGQDYRRTQSIDTCQVWAFRGPRGAIGAISQQLLGAK